MKKRLFSILIAVALIFGMTISAFADETKPVTDTNGDGVTSVTFTMSFGNGSCESEFYSQDMIYAELDIPYFDLALYGLKDYYYNPDLYKDAPPGAIFNGGEPGTPEEAEGVVTILHMLIYATEVSKLGIPVEQAGKGLMYSSGEMADHFQISSSQGVGSIFITKFWDNTSNMNYYLNYHYPEAKPGLGSTADQIALKDGDHISMHSISSSAFYGSAFGYFDADGEQHLVTVDRGDEVTMTLKYAVSDYNTGSNFIVIPNEKVYITKDKPKTTNASSWTELDVTDSDGNITIDTADLEAGIYYIGTNGASAYSNDAISMYMSEAAPAVIRLVVEDDTPAILYGDANNDGTVDVGDATAVLQYVASGTSINLDAAEVNGDDTVDVGDATAILQYIVDPESNPFLVEGK